MSLLVYSGFSTKKNTGKDVLIGHSFSIVILLSSYTKLIKAPLLLRYENGIMNAAV